VLGGTAGEVYPDEQLFGLCCRGEVGAPGESAPGNDSVTNNCSGIYPRRNPDPGPGKPDHPEPDPEQFIGLLFPASCPRPDSVQKCVYILRGAEKPEE